jgi:hypothetical protein
MLSGDALGEPALKSKHDVHRIMDKLGPIHSLSPAVDVVLMGKSVSWLKTT